jgi:hypothetical protein
MTAEISQIQYGSQTPDTAQIEDIVAMASDIQPLRVHLGRLLYLEFKEWNGTKRVELRFWKDDGNKVSSDMNTDVGCVDGDENVVSDMVSPLYWFFFYDW